MCIQFLPGPSGMCECSFQFRLWSINFWNIAIQFRALSPVFVNMLFKFVGHSSWARDSKSNFVYWYSFSSKFQSKSSPRCKGPITPDEYEWQNNEFVWKNYEFDPCIRNSLSNRDEFQWQLTNLNAELLNLIDKTNPECEWQFNEIEL